MAIDQGWYVANEGRQDGPFSGETLANMAAQGQLRPESTVWREGMADWTVAGDVPELAGMFQAAAPPVLPSPGLAQPPAISGLASESDAPVRPHDVLMRLAFGGASPRVNAARQRSVFLLIDIFAFAGLFMILFGMFMPGFSSGGWGSALRAGQGVVTLMLALGAAVVYIVAMGAPLAA